MATTTPNYGWTVPTSTDLVKDGATAIETLGDAIDASMNTALGTKKAGMVLLNTTSFSGVSTQSIGSDASPLFTSAYKNYRIFITGEGSSATTVDLNIRLRANTTDSTAANYTYWQQFRVVGSGGTDYLAGRTSFALGGAAASLRTHSVLDISYPQVADFTSMTVQSLGQGSSSSESSTLGGYHNLATSFNGITIFPGSGTITGEVSIYGYNA
jgi:hypothetical protein